MQARGGLITHNWERSQFDEGWKAIDGITMKRTILKDRHTCYACMIRCKRVVEVDHGPYLVDPLYGGPEYETLGLFGSSCGVGNLEAVAYANQLCNMYGMDTISCGGTIAWAMECFEKGIITLEDTGGIDLHFGNADALVQIVKMIALREGFGNILAEGSARAAEIIGRNSRELTVTVKKQELPAHMPHLKRSLALIYSVNPFGADHQSSEHDAAYNQFPAGLAQIGLTNPQPDRVLNEEKVRYALTTQFLYSFMDSADLCQFVFGPSWQLYSVNDLVEFIQAVTSWDMSVNEILTIGERRLNLLRAFNAREGIGREEDQLPEKLRKAITDGINAGLQIDFDELERAKDLYYAMAGWDIQTGQPTERKLESLGLGWLCKEVGVPRV
jgi:aldehyde:ferredoxin oxidoreductase